MESILETSAATILQFFAGLRGRLLMTSEESTSAAWLYDLLKPHVAELVVCNLRKSDSEMRAAREEYKRCTPRDTVASAFPMNFTGRGGVSKPSLGMVITQHITNS